MAASKQGKTWWRWVLLLALVIGVAWAVRSGATDALTLQNLKAKQGALAAWVASNPWRAAGLFFLVYVAVAAASIPGAAVMTLAGGALFGLLQGLLIVSFAWSYGLVMLMHAGSTLSSWKQYLDPFDGANLLFFAAWPMLAACIALFLLRDHDTLLSVGPRRR